MSLPTCCHTRRDSSCKKCRKAEYERRAKENEDKKEKKFTESVEQLLYGRDNLSADQMFIWLIRFLNNMKFQLNSRLLYREQAFAAFKKVFPQNQDIPKGFEECVLQIRKNMENASFYDGVYKFHYGGNDMFHNVEIPEVKTVHIQIYVGSPSLLNSDPPCIVCEKKCVSGVNKCENKSYCNAHYCKKCDNPKSAVFCGKCGSC